MNVKKLLAFAALVCALSTNGHAAVATSVNFPAASAYLVASPGNNEQMIAKMKWFAGLSVKAYEKLRGKRMNFFERISFKINQRRAKQLLKQYDADGATVLQKISWCFKGLILGPIALILGYIFIAEEERDLLKWIWFGFAGWCIILAIILLSI